MGAPGFWDDQAGAARISTEHSRLTRKLERYERLTSEYEDAREFLSLDEDEVAIAEMVQSLERELGDCKRTRSSTASTTPATPFSRSTPVRAARMRRTGRTCFCGCTCAGPATAGSPRR